MGNQQPSLKIKPHSEDSQYLIYSDGKIYSNKSHKFLSGKISSTGYREYALAIGDKRSQNGKKLSKMVFGHRIVAETFIPNPENLPYVHHRDEDKLNNRVENLEWVSALDNNLEAQKSLNRKKKSKAEYYEEDLLNEKWKDFPIDNTYAISSYGRIKNNKTNRLLKPDAHQKYLRVQLANKKHYYIHRLVYCTFYNDFNLDNYVIDHIDANPRNNYIENLQKISQSENCLKQGRFNDYPR